MARLKGFEKLTNVDNALTTFFKALKPKRLSPDPVTIENALGRVAAEDMVAPSDLPQFDRSAVDGYSVKAEDTFEASQLRPKTLKLIRKGSLGEAQAKQVWTGNPISKGANAVIMLEHTQAVRNGIEIIASVTPSENVSKKGEDIKKGQVAVQGGTRLQAHHLGLLAALRIAKVGVIRKPRIAIVSTGNELVEIGKETSPNQIINSNRFVVAGLCRELGAEPKYLGIARDDEKDIRTKIVEGLKIADVVITTGGTSVGAADLVPVVVAKLGKPGIVVHGVAMRPGMPTALGILKDKPIFVLSGYPVAATIGFEVFARPTILKLLGAENERRPVVQARLTRRVTGTLGRRVFLRVKTVELNGELNATPILTKGSGLLSSLTKANGYVVIPEDREGLEEGEIVAVTLFSSIATEEK